MPKKVITIFKRLHYLHNLFNFELKRTLSFPEFMELLFAKFEKDIRGKSGDFAMLMAIGEHRNMPINAADQEFKYVYDR